MDDRIGRFLMNVMLVSDGFSWTIIKANYRDQYMTALEDASTKENILPFAEFIKSQMGQEKVNKPCLTLLPQKKKTICLILAGD